MLLDRDGLDWADYSTEVRDLQALKQVLMGGFSERDARELLRKRQITDKALQEAILGSARDVETKLEDPGYHVLSLRLLADSVEEERSRGRTPEPETLRLPPGKLDHLADHFLQSLPSGVAERRIVRLARTPRFDVEALAAICSSDRDQRAEEVRHILGYSFVQPTALIGWYSTHPRMREAILQLPKFNTQTDAKAHHQEWASYWRSRSQAACDDFAGLAWFHDWQIDREAAFNHWQALASQARGELRTRDHQRVLEWIELTGIETDRNLDKFEARMLRAFAGELAQDALGHPGS